MRVHRLLHNIDNQHSNTLKFISVFRLDSDFAREKQSASQSLEAREMCYFFE